MPPGGMFARSVSRMVRYITKSLRVPEMRLPGLFRCGRAGLLSGRSDALRFEDGSRAPSCRSSDSGMLDRSASPLLLAMFLVLSHPGRSAFSQEVPAGRDSIDAAFAGKLQNNDDADEPSPDTLRLRSLESENERGGRQFQRSPVSAREDRI